MTRAARRWAAAAALALCTGCGAILGFNDGTLGGIAGTPCDSNGDAGCAVGLQCNPQNVCVPGTCGDAGCSPEASSSEGGASGLVTSFTGTPGGLVAFNEYVYFTYNDAVWGCLGTQACPTPAVMYRMKENPHPREIARWQNVVAWSDPVAGKLSYCSFAKLATCATALTIDEPGVGALATDITSNNLYFVTTPSGTTSELRFKEDPLMGKEGDIAPIPDVSTLKSLASDGSQRKFVQIGQFAYSIITPTPTGDGGDSPVVKLLVPNEPPSAALLGTAAIGVVTRRVVWTRAGGGLSQCKIEEGDTPCTPGSVRPFADAKDEITAMATTGDTVVWARKAGIGYELYFCKPTLADFTERACSATVLASGLSGRVSALTIEPPPLGPDNPPKRVYFMVNDSSTGSVLIQRTQLP